MSRVYTGAEHTFGAFARPARPYTVLIWAKPSALGTNRDAFALTDQVDFEGIRLRSTQFFAAISRATTTNLATTTVAVTVDVWHLVVARFNATNSREAFVNGTTGSGSNTITRDPQGDEVSIARAATNGNRWLGKLAHASVYGRAISDAEINGLAGGDNPQDVADLTFYLDMLTASLTDSVGSVVMFDATSTFDGADNPPVNAPASTFQAAWASRANTLIL